MRALVTGGAGFIGSHLVLALADRGVDVVVLDDLSTGDATTLPAGIRFVRGSVADAAAVADAVRGCEVVFHQAALKAVLRSVEHPVETDRVNVGGTTQLLTACRDAGVRRVVSASSSSVYGGALTRPTPESAALTPRSPYAVSKLAAEHYCRVFTELYGLETVSLRYFNVFGPRQRPDSRYAAVIPLFIDAVQTGTWVEVHGDGHQSRDFTFVSDVVRANLLAAEGPADACAGRVFNIATGHEHSLIDLVAAVERAVGTPARVRHVEPRAGDVRHSCADIGAAWRAFAYQPAVTFEDGLVATAQWMAGRRSAG